MLSSTIVALRTQGIDTCALIEAARFHFELAGPFDNGGRQRFWDEFLRARKSFRAAAGYPVEQVLTDTAGSDVDP